MSQRKNDPTCRQVRQLHSELLEFNRELVPRFVDGRGNAPTYKLDRAKRFLQFSMYMQQKLDEREGNSHVAIDAVWLLQTLGQLHVRSRLDCARYEDFTPQHPAMSFSREQHGKPGHAFASLASGSTPQRLFESAEAICTYLECPKKALDAVTTIQNAPLDALECALAAMDRGDYLELIEAQFMIRPETPVSFLSPHSHDLDSHVGYRSVRSNVCGNIMERLANNHFHQTIAIGQLRQCNGSWHGFIADQVFDILFQKWMWLMRGEVSGEPIELEQAGELSLAMQRGVVEGMLDRPAKSLQTHSPR